MTKKVITFGCRLNACESDVIEQFVNDPETVVVNTCAVTNEAERQCRQAVRKLAREGKKVIVTGCSAERSPLQYTEIDGVFKVFGNSKKLNRHEYSNKPAFPNINNKKSTFRSRVYAKIQTGCDNDCTFCIVPSVRGKSISFDASKIINNIKQTVSNGHKEVVLTGVNITDYKPSLGVLCKDILHQVPDLFRLRLSSVDAVTFDKDMYDLFASEPRLMPHVHISIQSGDDMVLKRMKRRHLRKDIIDFCHYLRGIRPGIVFGADFITGFPLETDEAFNNTVSVVDDAGITWLHVFPYSKRDGTAAAKMPQVPVHIRKSRAKILREHGEQIATQYYTSLIGKDVNVVVEKNNIGRTEHFAQVILDQQNQQSGIQSVQIVGYDKKAHIATTIDQ